MNGLPPPPPHTLSYLIQNSVGQGRVGPPPRKKWPHAVVENQRMAPHRHPGECFSHAPDTSFHHGQNFQDFLRCRNILGRFARISAGACLLGRGRCVVTVVGIGHWRRNSGDICLGNRVLSLREGQAQTATTKER